MAVMTTTLAAASAMMAWTTLEWRQRRRPSAVGAMIGAVVGLVTITPAAGYVSPMGAIAMGILGKARQAMTGSMKTTLEHAGVLSHRDGRARDGWSTRVVVLTDTALHFYKPAAGDKKRSEDEAHSAEVAEPTFKLGSTLRTGDFIWGREVGRMPMSMADVSSERVNDDGTTYTYITVTGGISGGFTPDSFVTKGIASVARAVERGSDRFKALLRTSDEALAAEWLAVLRTACGRQRSHGIEKLQAAIAQGDASLAANMAAGLATLSAAVPSRRASHTARMRANSPTGMVYSSNTHQPDAGTYFDREGSFGESFGPDSASYFSAGNRPASAVVVPARRHTRRVSGHDSSAASDVPTDDEVPEVKVVLVPPSEKKQLRESLAAAKMTIASQRSALQAAHDAQVMVYHAHLTSHGSGQLSHISSHVAEQSEHAEQARDSHAHFSAHADLWP